MDFAKRMWSQIGIQLEGVPLATKALIAALVVILIMSASFLMLYAGAEETVPFGPAGSNPAEVITKLQQNGIDAEISGGMIRVAPDQLPQAFAILQQGGLLGEDPSIVFDRMFSSQSPWETDKRDQQRMVIAGSRFLAAAVESIQGVKSASIMYDPGQDGIGKRHVRASAMASLTTTTGPVSTELADAVADMISGAVARIDVTDVKVVDARTGRRVAVSDPSSMLPSDALEVKRNIEERKRKEIENILDYIPDVRVGVNVLMDSIAAQKERRTEYDKDQPVEREMTEEHISRDIADAGEPGPRSNTGLSINGAGSSGREDTTNSTETLYYEKKPVLLEQDTIITGNQIKQINVAVNIPRSFFVGLYKQQNPDAEGEPSNADLTPIIQPELTKIELKVQVLTLAGVQGDVSADMVPDPPLVMTAGAGTTVSKMLDGGWGSTAGLAVLGLASLALMLKVYRNATRPESLPSIEELAGVPPSLPSDEELIGEADESETTMQGVELNEDDLKARRIAEQIGDLVRADPGEASRLLGKWVSTND
jgi:flagellar M-ring protein FliF